MRWAALWSRLLIKSVVNEDQDTRNHLESSDTYTARDGMCNTRHVRHMPLTHVTYETCLTHTSRTPHVSYTRHVRHMPRRLITYATCLANTPHVSVRPISRMLDPLQNAHAGTQLTDNRHSVISYYYYQLPYATK